MSHDPTALDDAEEDAAVAEELFDAFDTFSVSRQRERIFGFLRQDGMEELRPRSRNRLVDEELRRSL